MSGSGYKVLGFVVWRGARWYVRRTYGRYLPSRRLALAGAIAAATAGLVLVARRESD